MDAFALALRTLHADRNLGTAARYREQNAGPPRDIRVLRVITEDGVNFLQKIKVRSETFQVMRSDCPAPRAGDTLEVYDPADPLNPATTALLVLLPEPMLDANGLAWLCATRRA